MKKFILDTSKLINHWRRRRSRLLAPPTKESIATWAGELIDLYETDAIVTPVALEFLAGFTTQSELRGAEVFLNCFSCVDALDIREPDWQKARQIVRRIPRDCKPSLQVQNLYESGLQAAQTSSSHAASIFHGRVLAGIEPPPALGHFRQRLFRLGARVQRRTQLFDQCRLMSLFVREP